MRDAARFLAVAPALIALGCGNAEPKPALGPMAQAGAMAPMTTAGNGAAGATPSVNGAGRDAPAAAAGAGAGSAVPQPPSQPSAGSTAMPMAGAESPAGGAGGSDAPVDAYDYAMEQVSLSADLVIAKGQTLRVGPGTTFNAGNGVKVRVEGTLDRRRHRRGRGALHRRGRARAALVARHRDRERRAARADACRDWRRPPTASMRWSGSSYVVDFAEIGTSFKAAVLEANGSFDHTRFHASGDPTFSPVNEVSIEDVNGTLDHPRRLADDQQLDLRRQRRAGRHDPRRRQRLAGVRPPPSQGCPLRDPRQRRHNNTPVIKNSIFENMAYGLMVYATKPTIEDRCSSTTPATSASASRRPRRTCRP